MHQPLPFVTVIESKIHLNRSSLWCQSSSWCCQRWHSPWTQCPSSALASSIKVSWSPTPAMTRPCTKPWRTSFAAMRPTTTMLRTMCLKWSRSYALLGSLLNMFSGTVSADYFIEIVKEANVIGLYFSLFKVFYLEGLSFRAGISGTIIKVLNYK